MTLTFHHVFLLLLHDDGECAHLSAVAPVDVVRAVVDDGEADLVEAVGGEAGEGPGEALVLGRPALVAPAERGFNCKIIQCNNSGWKKCPVNLDSGCFTTLPKR